MNPETLANEKLFLKDILDAVKKELNLTEKRYDELSSTLRNNYDTAEAIAKQLRLRYKLLKSAQNAPYFARIDVQENDSTITKLRIGKISLYYKGDMAIVDWRAPISSIYYDGSLGPVSYRCPNGIEERILLLKRQYEIVDGKLLKYYDSDIFSDDGMLLEILKNSSDTRLKNIVATIQQEQNNIIRADLSRPLIVQGVAGSGKTTVALHRIAYLVYTYEGKIKPSDILIIAPNKFFLNYISNVLPDLGVDETQQLTFEDFCCQFIKDSITINNPNDKLVEVLKDVDSENSVVLCQATEYISSLEFLKAINNYIAYFETNMFSSKDFTINQCVIIKWEDIQQIFMQFSESNCIADRIERVKQYIKRYLQSQKEEILQLLKTNTTIDYDVEKEILKNNGIKFLNVFMKQVKLSTPLFHYAKVVAELDTGNKKVTAYIQKGVKERCKSKKVDYEDIAPLLYLQYRILGIKETLPKYVVIDEAQDLGPFQLYVINHIVNSSFMTILGDLAQGIYSYRGTRDWSIINENIFGGNAEIYNLDKSYRTTVEIMEAANKVVQNMNLAPSTAVLRHGNAINYTTLHSKEDIIQRIIELKKDGMINIGVIVKDEESAKTLYMFINTKLDGVSLISATSKDYSGSITIMPSYLSKGLEFDAVIIGDRDKYTDNELDSKLLYVSMTRAMHSLDVYSK